MTTNEGETKSKLTVGLFGNVDAGKSTLAGQLMCKSGLIDRRVFAGLEKTVAEVSLRFAHSREELVVLNADGQNTLQIRGHPSSLGQRISPSRYFNVAIRNGEQTSDDHGYGALSKLRSIGDQQLFTRMSLSPLFRKGDHRSGSRLVRLRPFAAPG